jgi:hypothetical protein
MMRLSDIKLIKKNYNIVLVIISLLSYLYIYKQILNNNFEIFFTYFIILFIGYFIFNKDIFILCFIIILYDIIRQNIEGNTSIEELGPEREDVTKHIDTTPPPLNKKEGKKARKKQEPKIYANNSKGSKVLK